ncbi:MAG TPA: Mur ligase family protein, partial [Azospirillaceae bacterium]|nr:Mur ligase family protein [Azospirillaceae bacterium]
MTDAAVKPVLWTAEEAAAATNGRLAPAAVAWAATGVAIDSRTVAPGDLFIAIKGPHHDGHAFVAKALESGAVAAIVSERPADVAVGAPLLVVDDTFAALEDLGRVARLRSKARVIAVTGSVGKTGTKEMLRACLSAQALTYATEGSLNNHWGVPLSLARLPADAVFGVFELGMNHAGELGPL